MRSPFITKRHYLSKSKEVKVEAEEEDGWAWTRGWAAVVVVPLVIYQGRADQTMYKQSISFRMPKLLILRSRPTWKVVKYKNTKKVNVRKQQYFARD